MNPLIASASFSQAGGGDPVAPTSVKVTNQNRQDWNKYISWLDSKGLKGHPSLDHNDLGMKMIDEYRKVNPNTTISREMVMPIQQDFSNYRNWAIDQIQKGKGSFAPGTNKDNFLKQLSIVDNVPGQRTTSFAYPQIYLKNMDNGQVQNKGFVTTDKPVTDQLSANQ